MRFFVLFLMLASSTSHAFRGNLNPLPLCSAAQITQCTGEALSGALECSSALLDCMEAADPVACTEDLAADQGVDTTEDICEEVGAELFGECLVDEACSSQIDPIFP